MPQSSERKRYAHLVGRIPYEDEATAMRKAMDFLGHSIRSMPDGEIRSMTGRPDHGERWDWAQWVTRKLREGGALDPVRRGAVGGGIGLWSDLRRAKKQRLRVLPEQLYRHLNFGLCERFTGGYQVFKQLRTQHKWKVKFQFGIPGPLAFAMFSLGIMGGIRHRRVFEDRLVKECGEIYKIARDDVVFQLELPLELVLAMRIPAVFRPAAREWIVNNIASFVRRLDEGAVIGIHLCLKYAGTGMIRNVKPLVKFVNEIVRQWPKGRALSYVHVPLAMPGERASTDRRFYESLRRLNLPQEVRFVAGFVDGRLSEDDHTRILRTIEGILKRSVDVSSPCGFERGGTASCEDLLVTTANLVR